MTSSRRQSTDTLETLLQAGPAWCRVFTHDGFCILDSRPTVLLDRSIYGVGAARGGQPLPVAHRTYTLPDGFRLVDGWQSHARVEGIPVNDQWMREIFRMAQDSRRDRVRLVDGWQSHARVETIPVNDQWMREIFRMAQDSRRWYVLLHDYCIPSLSWLGVTAIGHSYRAWTGSEYFSLADLAALDAAR